MLVRIMENIFCNSLTINQSTLKCSEIAPFTYLGESVVEGS